MKLRTIIIILINLIILLNIILYVSRFFVVNILYRIYKWKKPITYYYVFKLIIISFIKLVLIMITIKVNNSPSNEKK